MGDWEPVVGFENFYRISESGEVYSIRRSRLLKPGTSSGGYPLYRLTDENKRLHSRKPHRMVAEAFIGPAPTGKDRVLHNDGNPLNNHVSNLRWGTARENNLDTIKHGKHNFASREQCSAGHDYTEESTYTLNGCRYCRICKRERAADRKRKGISQDDPRHGTVNAYINFSCRCEACKKALSEYQKKGNTE